MWQIVHNDFDLICIIHRICTRDSLFPNSLACTTKDDQYFFNFVGIETNLVHLQNFFSFQSVGTRVEKTAKDETRARWHVDVSIKMSYLISHQNMIWSYRIFSTSVSIIYIWQWSLSSKFYTFLVPKNPTLK